MAGVQTDEIDETRRLAEASAWRVALFEADLEATEDFEHWLAAHPGNALAWRQVTTSWDRFSDDAMEPELIIARRDALEGARRHRQLRFAGSTAWRHTGVRVAAVLLVAVLAATLVGLGVWRANRSDIYQTALGERRTITLTDGSHVALDSGSLLKVRLKPRSRALELVRGQARFEVAHDTARPFTVHAGDKTVVATGTSFNVDVLGANVIVTLIDGRVSILQDRPPRLPVISPRPVALVVAKLTPGEQLVAPQAEPSRLEAPTPKLVVQTASIDRTIAWETGQLVFDNEPLASVAERVARYGDRPVVVDRGVAGLRLSGVFSAGDLNTFLDAVQRALPVSAETGEDGVVHLRRSAG